MSESSVNSKSGLLEKPVKEPGLVPDWLKQEVESRPIFINKNKIKESTSDIDFFIDAAGNIIRGFDYHQGWPIIPESFKIPFNKYLQMMEQNTQLFQKTQSYLNDKSRFVCNECEERVNQCHCVSDEATINARKEYLKLVVNLCEEYIKEKSEKIKKSKAISNDDINEKMWEEIKQPHIWKLYLITKCFLSSNSLLLCNSCSVRVEHCTCKHMTDCINDRLTLVEHFINLGLMDNVASK